MLPEWVTAQPLLVALAACSVCLMIGLVVFIRWPARFKNPSWKFWWPGKGSTVAGPVLVNGEKALRLTSGTSLHSRDGNTFILSGYHHPPATLFMAIGLTIITGIIARAFMPRTMPPILPGWLFWYVILVIVHRVRLDINLDSVEAIGVDPETSRIAVRTLFNGDQRWLVLAPHANGQRCCAELTRHFENKEQQVKITAPSPLPILLLLVLIGVVASIIFQFARTM